MNGPEIDRWLGMARIGIRRARRGQADIGRAYEAMLSACWLMGVKANRG